MFERFTEKARRMIFFARYEASQFGSPYIESEHLLLGLVREDKRIVLVFFRSHLFVEEIRKKVEQHTIIREKVSTSVDLPLSNEGKRVLAYAAEEAERLEHKHIGTEHLLLGLMREKESFAAQLLNEAGLELQDARRRVGEGVAKGVLDGDVQGGGPANLFLRMQIDQLRKFAWHKREWKALDVFRQDGTGLASFDPTLRDDPTFKFVPVVGQKTGARSAIGNLTTIPSTRSATPMVGCGFAQSVTGPSLVPMQSLSPSESLSTAPKQKCPAGWPGFSIPSEKLLRFVTR